MIIFPAIDLKDGKCVRLQKGEMSSATIFNDSPEEQALKFQHQGFSWLHIVDLNGAFAGKPVNIGAVNAIIKNVTIPAQLGGGIRDIKTIEYWLEAGITRVILGTAALHNPGIVIEACNKFPGKIVLGLDGKSGKVAVSGWAETSGINIIDLAHKFADMGVAAILYTDIGRDGMLDGLDIPGTKTLAEAVNIPVIASGGVGSMQDLQAVKNIESSGVCGVVVGRALYDGRINIEQAIKEAAA